MKGFTVRFGFIVFEIKYYGSGGSRIAVLEFQGSGLGVKALRFRFRSLRFRF